MHSLKHFLLALGVACAGCGESTESISVTRLAADPLPEEENLGYLDQLASLGYVDFAEEVDEDLGQPLRVYDREAAWDGINLYTSIPHASGFLMGMDGRVLHKWSDEVGSGVRWSSVELMPDGDVLCVTSKKNALIRMSWDGTERWSVNLDAHHDVRLAPDNRIITLTRSLRQLPEVHAERRSVDNDLVWLDLSGNVLSEHSLYDILSTVPELPIVAPPTIDEAPERINVDPIHANAVEPMDFDSQAERNPIFARGNLLVTLRVTSAIVMLTPDADHPGGYRVLWHWGVGEIEGPHDASVMENGNILVLDNGWMERGYSRVVEVDPITRQIVWEYTAPVPTDFFTAGRGTVQPLPNGNVLVGNSNSGEAFEVTREGRIVWRYMNPNVDPQGRRGALRVRRYERAAIEAILRHAPLG